MALSVSLLHAKIHARICIETLELTRYLQITLGFVPFCQSDMAHVFIMRGL